MTNENNFRRNLVVEISFSLIAIAVLVSGFLASFFLINSIAQTNALAQTGVDLLREQRELIKINKASIDANAEAIKEQRKMLDAFLKEKKK